MNNIKSFIPLATLALITACAPQNKPSEYEIKVPVADPALNGTMAYLVNYDTGEKMDSVIVNGDTARFAGVVDQPYLARIIVDGQRAGVVIVEAGVSTPDEQGLYLGTALNDTFAATIVKLDSLEAIANEVPHDSLGMIRLNELNTEYDTIQARVVRHNASNPVGYYFFLQQAYRMDLNELNAALNQLPSLQKFKRIKDLRVSLKNKAETSVGMPYKDFEVPGDSVAQRLSTYVGRDGKFTLVDFWASWCGPCRREIPVIREIAERHAAEVNVVGVAVWDKPEDTRRAIEELNIKWPVIIDAQNIPTDIYGIPGIPCIILIDPSGTIVSRDKQGDDLRADVDRQIGAYHKKLLELVKPAKKEANAEAAE